MDPEIVSAIIAALVAFAASLLALLPPIWQARQQIHELASQIETLRQSQFGDVIRKRLEAYPKLWSLLVRYGRNWTMARRPKDGKWATEFLTALNECNADIGVFFSEDLYKKFAAFRAALAAIEVRFSSGENVSPTELKVLDEIVLGTPGTPGTPGNPGLATFMKDDLGSYSIAAIQARAR